MWINVADIPVNPETLNNHIKTEPSWYMNKIYNNVHTHISKSNHNVYNIDQHPIIMCITYIKIQSLCDQCGSIKMWSKSIQYITCKSNISQQKKNISPYQKYLPISPISPPISNISPPFWHKCQRGISNVPVKRW